MQSHSRALCFSRSPSPNKPRCKAGSRASLAARADRPWSVVTSTTNSSHPAPRIGNRSDFTCCFNMVARSLATTSGVLAGHIRLLAAVGHKVVEFDRAGLLVLRLRAGVQVPP